MGAFKLPRQLSTLLVIFYKLSKVLLLKITPTQLIKNGAVKVVQTKSILP